MAAPRLAPTTGLLPGKRPLTNAATATNAVTAPTSPCAAVIAATSATDPLIEKKNKPSARNTPAKAHAAASQAALKAIFIGDAERLS